MAAVSFQTYQHQIGQGWLTLAIPIHFLQAIEQKPKNGKEVTLKVPRT